MNYRQLASAVLTGFFGGLTVMHGLTWPGLVTFIASCAAWLAVVCLTPKVP